MEIFEILFTFFVFLTTLFIWKTLKRKKEPKNFPPGPRSYVPILGGILSAGMEPFKTFMHLSKKWGGIFAYDLGSDRIIIVNDCKAMKEMTAQPQFNGRLNTEALLYMMPGHEQNGILFNTGNSVWMEQRRFTMRNLRDFGFGKKSIEDKMEYEARVLMEAFQKLGNQPVLINHQFQGAVVNSVWSTLLGSRMEQDDSIILDLYKRSTQIATALIFLINFPIFFKLHKWFPRIFTFVGHFIENNKHIKGYIKRVVEDHKRTYDKGFDRDLVDRYLREIGNEKDPNSSFFGQTGELNLISVCNDMFLAGSETTSNALNWTVHLLSIHQEIQERAFQEINLQIGNSRHPCLADRQMCVYTEALILEVLRMATIVPMTPHEVMEDAEYGGFYFPKGTAILYNLYAMLHDPDIWGDPEVFRPDRFLSPDGKGLINHPNSVPFFTGKRACLGESLARNTMFLFVTSIIQRFKLIPDPTRPTPTKIKSIPGSTTSIPVPFPIIFKERFN